MSWNGSLATGASIEIGFNGTYTGTPTAREPVDVHAQRHGVHRWPTTTTPTTTTTTTTTRQPADPGSRVNNPYVGASVYVNPDWSAKANAEAGGSRIANQPTGVWMDRIAAIDGTTGARGLVAPPRRGGAPGGAAHHSSSSW